MIREINRRLSIGDFRSYSFGQRFITEDGADCLIDSMLYSFSKENNPLPLYTYSYEGWTKKEKEIEKHKEETKDFLFYRNASASHLDNYDRESPRTTALLSICPDTIKFMKEEFEKIPSDKNPTIHELYHIVHKSQYLVGIFHDMTSSIYSNCADNYKSRYSNEDIEYFNFYCKELIHDIMWVIKHYDVNPEEFNETFLKATKNKDKERSNVLDTSICLGVLEPKLDMSLFLDVKELRKDTIRNSTIKTLLEEIDHDDLVSISKNITDNMTIYDVYHLLKNARPLFDMYNNICFRFSNVEGSTRGPILDSLNVNNITKKAQRGFIKELNDLLSDTKSVCLFIEHNKEEYKHNKEIEENRRKYREQRSNDRNLKEYSFHTLDENDPGYLILKKKMLEKIKNSSKLD